MLKINFCSKVSHFLIKIVLKFVLTFSNNSEYHRIKPGITRAELAADLAGVLKIEEEDTVNLTERKSSERKQYQADKNTYRQTDK